MKRGLLVLVLLVFARVGVAHIINPDWFVNRSGVRKGGRLLTDWNRFGFQIAGGVFAAFAIYGLYVLLPQLPFYPSSLLCRAPTAISRLANLYSFP
jgi:hypothetical protein